VIDIYRRLLKPVASEAHYLNMSKLATLVWGVFACGVATIAVGLGSLIEVVNRFGSIFYGSLLGVFVLALTFKRATGTGAFVGLLAGLSAVLAFAFHPATKGISFLWHNPLGVVVVLIVGAVVSLMTQPERA
jgi:Na+/proline symporter